MEQQRAERETKVQQRNKEIEDIKERNNSVWCHLALTLDKTSLMYIRHDCLSKDGTGDGAKGWRLLQQLGEEEKLHEYFIRSQQLMSRLTEAGENMTEILFNALVINGLPERYEHLLFRKASIQRRHLRN